MIRFVSCNDSPSYIISLLSVRSTDNVGHVGTLNFADKFSRLLGISRLEGRSWGMLNKLFLVSSGFDLVSS